MTVGSSTNRVSYSGNGSTTAFAFAYPYRASSDLIVTVRTTATGAESLKVEGSDYTVSGTPNSDAGGFASGTVTFGTAPASGTQVHIDRVPGLTQTADLVAGDGMQPSSWEGAIDKLALVTQELSERFARTLLQPRTAANRNLVLPEPSSTNSSKYLRTNSAGTGYELTGSAPPTITVSVRDYGAVGDGTTEDHVAIQAAIDAVSAAGGGTVFFRSGTYLIGATITLKSKVVLQGEHYATTTIKAKNSLNADMLKTLNYATLTGQNKYLISEGLQYGFGLSDIGLDGNKTNNTSGNGLVCYGKKYFLKNVSIRHVKEIGWVSEAWYNVNTATFPEEPESHYDYVDVQNCGSHGIQYRGPTDAIWDCVISHQNGGWGIRFETDHTTYNGASDLHFAHVYANTTGGVYVGTRMRVGHLGTESHNTTVALEDVSTGGSTYNFIESYFNGGSPAAGALVLSGTNIKVSKIYHSDNGMNGVGVVCSGTRNTISAARVVGTSSTSTGIVASGTGHRICAEIAGYSGAGGKGYQHGSGATALTGGTLDLEISDCKTAFAIQAAGVRNQMRLTLTAGASQSVQSGGAFSSTERGTVTFSDTTSSFAYNINAPTLMQQSAVAASVTGTTTETILATISIPANAMGANGALRVYSTWSYTNSANNKNTRVRFGGIGGTVCMNYTLTTTATLSDLRRIQNRNATNSQTVSASTGGHTGGFGSSTSTLPAPATDTTAAVDLVLTGQLANTGETITLESYVVELIRS